MKLRTEINQLIYCVLFNVKRSSLIGEFILNSFFLIEIVKVIYFASVVHETLHTLHVNVYLF